MLDEITARIRFIKDCDGYAPGHEMETTPGIADAYVNHRLAAEYVVVGKSVKSPMRDKMMRTADAVTK